MAKKDATKKEVTTSETEVETNVKTTVENKEESKDDRTRVPTKEELIAADKKALASLPKMSLFMSLFNIVTLGLLIGWYHFLLVFYPACIYFIYYGGIPRIIASILLAIFIADYKYKVPLKPWYGFLESYVFVAWHRYFNFDVEVSSLYPHMNNHIKEGETKKNGEIKKERFIFFEFPHGVFPIGQVLTAPLVEKFTPGEYICATGASILFKVPMMKHIMAWMGTRPANRKSMTGVFENDMHVAVIPGGIAEMYVVTEDKETIYMKSRRGTVRLAIQNGAHIVPAFFFGNSKILTVKGNDSNGFLAKLSRKLRMSIIFFYGRFGLPIPYRYPCSMASGEIVRVVQNDNPTDAQIDEVIAKVCASVEKVYYEKRPEWEIRPLVIL